MLNYNSEATVHLKYNLERAAKYFWIISLMDNDRAMSVNGWTVGSIMAQRQHKYWDPRQLGLHAKVFTVE